VSGLDGTSAAAHLRRWVLDALWQHRAEGTLPTSIRHLFYEAVMAGVVAKSAPNRQRGRRADQNLADAVLWLREQGSVPWQWIEDRTRSLVDLRGFPTLVDGLAEILPRITVDPWADVQPIVVAESESIAGVLVREAESYRVPIVPTRGQSHGFLRTTVADALGGRTVAVCYLGDADKAGFDIENNTFRVLGDVLAIKDWTRIGLTWEQVEQHGLPTVERADRRNGRTYEVCEIEALPQRILMIDVRAYLDLWLVEPLDSVLVREQQQRAEIAELLGISRELS
jgi:hypothetical protein